MIGAAATTPETLPPADKIRELADNILARPEYRLDDQRLDWGPVLDWIFEIVRKIFGPVIKGLDSIIAISPALGWTVVVLLAIVCIALLTHIIYTLLTAMRGPRGRLGALAPAEPVSHPADWEARARAAAGRGDLIGAIRCLFRAGVLRIEAARNRSFRRGVTNHEILRAVGGSPLADHVGALVSTIDYKWYGGAECSAEDYERCSAAYDGIRSLTREKPHAARP